MKLLWTLSNWKRTGPVEPSLDLARALVTRGHRVAVAANMSAAEPSQGESTSQGNSTTQVIDAYGLEYAESGAGMHKHAAPWRNLPDIRRLHRWMRVNRPDAVVSTLRNGHTIAMHAARGLGVPVVRLWFGDGTEELKTRERRAFQSAAAVVTFGERPARRLREIGCAADRIRMTGAPLDIERLRADLTQTSEPSQRFRFGIVARMQTHRRFEMLWDAVKQLRAIDGPAFELLAIGRGTNQGVVAHEPVAAMGLSDVVSFPGYLRGSDYVNTVASLDAQIFLVPGSDATCRALREGMALGVPSITTPRGLLSEIVVDGETGLVVEETAEAFARGLHQLRADRAAAATMGAAARDRADAVFDVRAVAATVEDVVRHAVSKGVPL